MDRNLRWIGTAGGIRAFGQSLLGPFFVLYLHNVLGVGFVEVGLLAVAVGIGPLIVSGVGGLWADRFGRRRLFVLALGGEAAGVFLTAGSMVTASLPLVVIGFGVVGIMGALGGPALSAYVADLAQGSERTRGFTWLRVGWNAGFTAGVGVGGGLIGALNFVPVAFLAGFAVSAAAILVAVKIAPSPYDLALSERRAARAIPVVAPAPVRSIRQSVKVLGRDRPFLLFVLASALANLVLVQWAITFPLFVNVRLGVPYGVLGLGLAVNGLVVVFGQTAMTEASVGHRHTTLAIIGLALYVVAFLGLGVAGLLVLAPTAVFFVAVLVLSLGENLEAIPQTTLPSNMAPPEEVGAYNGAYWALTGIGLYAAILLGTVALAVISNPLLLWAILVAPAIPAAALFAFVARRINPTANRA